MQTIDLNTPEGVAAWMKQLPTENLQDIASRPLDSFNFFLVSAAGMELIIRGEK